ncbi:MAG TPA: NAD-dependent epimerase/dehydratase family protein, partial [Myxococcaceae bacterium]|nr:NAD-dependent epimerase/dehydratase family protein [Myxococcaceae bacterium]
PPLPARDVTGASGEKQTMHFLLTGGSGFIGSNLARAAISRGHRVRALVRRTSVRAALEAAGAAVVEGDLFTGEGVRAALEDVDCILHLAGATKARSAVEFHRCNAESTRTLAEAAASLPKPPRLVYCSSLAAAGPTSAGKPKSEDEEPSPVSTYGRSKLAGEMALRQFADRLPCVIVRPPIVYGPCDREFLPALLPMARMGLMLKSGFGPKYYSLVHVDDLCEGILGAALKGKTLDPNDPAQGVYFLSDGCEYSWEEFSAALSRALGRSPARVLSLPDVVSYAAGLGAQLNALLRGRVPMLSLDKARELRCEAWTCSSERAKNELCYQPSVPLDKGLEQTISWYRKEGWI